MVMPRAFSSGAASIWSYAFASPPNFFDSDCSRQGGFTVVNVTDGADVHVRLGPFEFTFCHFRLLRSNDILGITRHT